MSREHSNRTDQERFSFVPREVLVRMEILSMLGVTIFLMVLSILRPAPLGPAPDPLTTPPDVSAPWIFAGVQELLRYFPPLAAGIVIPLLLYLLLMFLPFFSRSVTEEGGATLNKRIGIFLFFLFLLLCLAAPACLHFVR